MYVEHHCKMLVFNKALPKYFFSTERRTPD